MSSYWGKHPAVFITFTSRYIRILVGNKKHQYTYIIQKIVQEDWIVKGEIVNEEEMTKLLQSLVKEYKLTGMKTYISFSAHDLLLRTTKIPLSVPEDEWKGFLYLNLGESYHLPFSDPIIEIVGSEEKDEVWQVNTLAVPEKEVNRKVEILKKAHLRPVVMDVPFLNLYRVFQTQHQLSADSHVLVVQMELNDVQLSLFHRHEPVYVRTFDLAEIESFSAYETRTGFQYLDVSDDQSSLNAHYEVIQKEIERIQSFYQFNLQQGKASIDTICLAGDHPKLVELYQDYRENASIHVHFLHEEAWGTKTKKKIPDSFAELIGLSRK